MSNKKLLTFSKENMDILELLNTKPNASQFVCDAVRFFEDNTNRTALESSQDKDFETVEKNLMDKLNRIERLLISKSEVKRVPVMNIDEDLIKQILNEED